MGVRRVVITSLLLLGLLSGSLPAGAVTGGTAVPPADLAGDGRVGWLVRLETGVGRCSGALVDPEWVLTAAHCADGTIEAFVGDAATAAATDTVEIDPDHAGGTAHDVALIHLVTPSTATPVALGLVDGDTPDTDGTVGLLGWGLTTSGGGAPTAPSEGNATIETRGADELALGPDPANGCDGDSGGPVVAGGAVVAVMTAADASCVAFTTAARLSASATFLDGVLPDPPDLDPLVQSGHIDHEGGGSLDITFTATTHDGQPLNLDDHLVGVSDGSGTLGDCSSTVSPITCAWSPGGPGDATVTFTFEDDEGRQATGTWTIDVTALVGIINLQAIGQPFVVDEGDGGTTDLEFAVVASPPILDDVQVQVEALEATPGVDVDAGPLDVFVTNDIEPQTLSITSDNLPEGDERFRLVPVPADPAHEGVAVEVVIRDDDDGTITPRRDVVAEAVLDPGERLRVPYAVPTARNQNGQAVAVTCTPRPGSRFAPGDTDATCRSVPGARRRFTVTVQAPTSPGKVTTARGQVPITCAATGSVVRVRAGGFTPGSPVTVGLLLANGSVQSLAATRAGAGAGVNALASIPGAAARGPRQLVVTGPSGPDSRVRSFDLRLAGTC